MTYSFDKNAIRKSVRLILEKNPTIRAEIKENFSRLAASFYPMLYVELFKEEYCGKESFSKAMALYQFIKRDKAFLNELFELNEVDDDDVFEDIEEKSEKEFDKKVCFLFKRKCEDQSVIAKSKKDV
jgi:hypothetical protein